MIRRPPGSGACRSLVLLAACLALGACQSIHNPNVVAAEHLPDGPVGWFSGPPLPDTPRCDSAYYRDNHPVECPPLRTDYHCDNPVVRQVFRQSCQPLDPPREERDVRDKARRN